MLEGNPNPNQARRPQRVVAGVHALCAEGASNPNPKPKPTPNPNPNRNSNPNPTPSLRRVAEGVRGCGGGGRARRPRAVCHGAHIVRVRVRVRAGLRLGLRARRPRVSDHNRPFCVLQRLRFATVSSGSCACMPRRALSRPSVSTWPMCALYTSRVESGTVAPPVRSLTELLQYYIGV